MELNSDRCMFCYRLPPVVFFFFVQEAGKGKERTKRRLKMCSMQTLSDAIGIFLITSQEVSEERWKFLEYKKYARTSLLSQITFSKH